MKMKKRIIFALVLIGATSMIAQILLMRQLLVIFYGNELSIGITLASWLFWIAFGSWAIGRWATDKIKQKLVAFSFFEIILGFLLPLSILGAKFIPSAFKFFPGEIIGIFPMIVSTFVLLAPICILCGLLFVLGCEVYKTNQKGAVQIGHVYILEAVGASIGGLIVSLFLIKYSSPLYIMIFIGVLNLFMASLLLRGRKILSVFTWIIIAGFIFIAATGKFGYLHGCSLREQWKDYELLASENSIYGNIAVTKKENLFSVFTNGLYGFTVPDELTSERNAHFPLLEHPNPKKILLIGGGLSGQLREVLKYPIEHVDYVELDPLLIKLAKEHLPSSKIMNDLRVHVISNMDGRLFIKRTYRKYDVVIINLPGPHTAQLNRFYTKEFYTEIKNILRDNGVLSFYLSSNPNYISQEQLQLYITIKNTLLEVFPEVKITPGQTNYFLASARKGMLTLDWRVLMQRLRRRNVKTKYMREHYLFSELSKERINFFNQRLDQAKSSAVNTDFRPIAYYYDIVLWNTFFKYNLKGLFKAVNPKRIYIGAFCIYLFLLIIPIFLKSIKRKTSNWAILVCMGTTGFAEISFQIITLLSFQVLYGYVYYKLGVILTSYMIGLIFGGWLITKRLKRQKNDYKIFIKTQVAIFIYPLILPALFLLFSNLKGGISFWIGSNIVFPFLPLVAGFIGGFQFPLANSIYMKAKALKVSHSASLIYGLDLFGSCVGALLVSVFLIPIIGIPMSCFLIAGLNLVGLILLLKA